MLTTKKVGKPEIWILVISLLAASIGRMDVKIARADVGPVPIVPPGTTLQSTEQTPVQMLSETVQMDVRLATESDAALLSVHPDGIPYGIEWLPAVADVQANFTMYNPTQQDIELTTWFPLAGTLDDSGLQGQIGAIRVSVDGNEIGTSQVELPNPVRAGFGGNPLGDFSGAIPKRERSTDQGKLHPAAAAGAR